MVLDASRDARRYGQRAVSRWLLYCANTVWTGPRSGHLAVAPDMVRGGSNDLRSFAKLIGPAPRRADRGSDSSNGITP